MVVFLFGCYYLLFQLFRLFISLSCLFFCTLFGISNLKCINCFYSLLFCHFILLVLTFSLLLLIPFQTTSTTSWRRLVWSMIRLFCKVIFSLDGQHRSFTQVLTRFLFIIWLLIYWLDEFLGFLFLFILFTFKFILTLTIDFRLLFSNTLFNGCIIFVTLFPY